MLTHHLLAALVIALPSLQLPAATTFDPARWHIVDPGARSLPYLGRPSLFLDNGVALARDSSFADGTIDVDVAMHGHASFAGIVFRAAAEDSYELVYLRPHRSRQPDALQYTPVFGGSEGWQLYSGLGYTAAAELPPNRWVHVRVVVSGYSARMFVDGAPEPQLVVTDLKRPWARGQVGLWGRSGGANFSNFAVSPANTIDPAKPPDPPASEQLLMNWALSPSWETPMVPADSLPDRKAPGTMPWTSVRAEGSGIVNIARFRRLATTSDSPTGSRSLVFARNVITSALPRRARLTFGYSDGVHIFLNGRLVFTGESGFRSRDPGFLGIVSVGPDAVYLDLVPGANELVFAVTETFGGWGFAARLDPLGPALGLDGRMDAGR